MKQVFPKLVNPEHLPADQHHQVSPPYYVSTYTKIMSRKALCYDILDILGFFFQALRWGGGGGGGGGGGVKDLDGWVKVLDGRVKVLDGWAVTKTRTGLGLGLDWAWTGQYTVLYTPGRILYIAQSSPSPVLV